MFKSIYTWRWVRINTTLNLLNIAAIKFRRNGITNSRQTDAGPFPNRDPDGGMCRNAPVHKYILADIENVPFGNHFRRDVPANVSKLKLDVNIFVISHFFA